MSDRVYNFSPGPAVLPEPVLQQAQQEFMSLPGLGMSVLEISHRSSTFKAIHAEAQNNLRQLLRIPANYRILLLQGGSRLQFAMVPMNLAHRGQAADYLVTGTWSKKALEECQLRKDLQPRRVCNFSDSGFDRIPQPGSYEIDAKSAFAYYCSNETVQGVQFPTEPDSGDVPLVCDASSDFLSRPLPIDQYGMIYACAEKCRACRRDHRGHPRRFIGPQLG